MNDFLVSVIVPCYNGVRTLEETVQSVLHQTYGEWELLIVDDGSTDESAELIRQLAHEDQRIRPVFLQRNGGVAAARNAGLDRARGRLVAFLDADDIWEPDKLEQQVSHMGITGAAFAFTAYGLMDREGNRSGRMVRAREQIRYTELLKGNQIGCSTVMLDLARLGPVRMPEGHHEDYLLWLQILKDGWIAHGLSRPLTVYRKDARSLSGNKWRAARWTWEVYRVHQRLSLPQSLWFFAHYAIRGVLKSIG